MSNFKIKVEAKCLKCGKTTVKHHAKGYCKQCYSHLWWKEKQGVDKKDLTDSA